MRPRLGFNGATTGTADLPTDIRAAASAGFDALELRDTKLQRYLHTGGSLPGLRQQIVRAGLEAASLNALERSTLVSAAARDGVMDRCRLLCTWAAALLCPTVIAVPSAMTDADDPAQITARTAETLRALAEIAASYHVRVGFEFLGSPGCSVRTLAQAQEILRTAAHPALGLVIDTFHFYSGCSTWEMLDALDPSELLLVHLDDAEDFPISALTDAHRVLPGDGVIPLRELVRRLQALGYRGLYSVELFRPEYWTWDPEAVARVAKQKMEALFD